MATLAILAERLCHHALLLLFRAQIIDRVAIVVCKLGLWGPCLAGCRLIILLMFTLVLSPCFARLNGLLDVFLVLLNQVFSLALHVFDDLAIHFFNLLKMLSSARNAVIHWVRLLNSHQLGLLLLRRHLLLN